jgi:hypothetical protein
MKNRLLILIASSVLASCTTIQHPEIAVYEQYNSMLDRCNVIGQTTGEVYMGMNHTNNRSNRTVEARNAMRKKAKEMGGDALLAGDIGRSDILGNYHFTMTVLDCSQQKTDSKNINYRDTTKNRLEKLKRLLDDGTITQEEYTSARGKILTDI